MLVNMKKILRIGFTIAIMGIPSFTNAQMDTTGIVGFTLEESSITLRVGESHQLCTNPANADIIWHESWGLSYNPVVIVDEKGLVTALNPGGSIIIAESKNGSIMRQCVVSVLDNGNIIKGRKNYNPVDECEWKDVEFSLNNNGLFKVEGTYYGSGAQTNYLNYIVSDQCIFLWFDIDYEDSTKMFYPQQFSLEIDNCNAQAYNVYFNNGNQVVESQSCFVRYSIARGTSTGISIDDKNKIFGKENDKIYDLGGRVYQTIPKKGLYIKNGTKHMF